MINLCQSLCCYNSICICSSNSPKHSSNSWKFQIINSVFKQFVLMMIILQYHWIQNFTMHLLLLWFLFLQMKLAWFCVFKKYHTIIVLFHDHHCVFDNLFSCYEIGRYARSFVTHWYLNISYWIISLTLSSKATFLDLGHTL